MFEFVSAGAVVRLFGGAYIFQPSDLTVLAAILGALALSTLLLPHLRPRLKASAFMAMMAGVAYSALAASPATAPALAASAVTLAGG
ncbi:MAG: hypothetical protein AAGF90_04805 [Pseudomonadota bacterium]